MDRSDEKVEPAGLWMIIQPDRVTTGAATASALSERFMQTPSLVGPRMAAVLGCAKAVSETSL
jgi:hypothetical protein